MKLLDYLRSSKPSTATVAKERLKVIVAHERSKRENEASFVPQLQREILEVIKKYVEIDQDQIKVDLEQQGDYSILELNITLPETSRR